MKVLGSMGRGEKLEVRERVGNDLNIVLMCEILQKINLKHNKTKLTYLETN